MQITTTQLYSRHAASLQANGWKVIDVTVKSGVKAFAPSWDIVLGYKNGSVSEDEYTSVYHQMMRDSFKKNNAVWVEAVQWNKVALACYCKPGDFCHRHLLKNYLGAAAEKIGIPVSILEES